jgi:hypothetical protein
MTAFGTVLLMSVSHGCVGAMTESKSWRSVLT